MQTHKCSYRSFEVNARLAFFAGGPGSTPEQPEQPEVKVPEIPEVQDVSKEHVKKMISSIDFNVTSVESYYRSSIRHDTMPENIKKQLADLKTLKERLVQLQYNPARARDLFADVYKIFKSLEDKKRATIKQGEGDPLLGFLYDIAMPTLTVTPKAVPEKKLTWKEQQEVKEKENALLFRTAVENTVRGQGELTQPMLDQIKAQITRVGYRPLICNINIDGNPVMVFLEGSAAGFKVTGIRYSKEKPLLDQAPSWTKATFTDTYSYTAGDKVKPVFPDKPEDYIALALKNRQYKPDKDLA